MISKILEPEVKLLALDFSNLIIRHAANPYGGAEDRQGRSVNGPVGALTQAIRLVESEKPTHLLIARDGSRGDSFRREIDPGYKAHRPDADDDIRHQFALSYQALELLGWPVLDEHAHEADDILASAAKRFEGRTVIVTGDKDLLACAAPDVRISVLRPGGSVECGPKEAEEIFGVPPELIQDYKALVGDSSDGIRGIEGIGPKRALSLLGEYGDLRRLLIAARSGETLSGPGISPAVAQKVVDGIESAEISYRLAGLVDDLEVDFDSLRCPTLPDEGSHGPALEEIGLGALRAKLPGAQPPKKREPLPLDEAFNKLF